MEGCATSSQIIHNKLNKMQGYTFRRSKSESIGQWLYKHRRAIFIATLRAAVYSTTLMAAYNVITGGWSVYVFLEDYVFPIFQEVM
jgi:hypothetical protein